MIISFLFLLALQTPEFIKPIETMADVKGDIVYADRSSPFFLIIEDNILYIGHPKREGGIPGHDVPYTWGEVSNCSIQNIECVKAGAFIFVRSRASRAPVTLDKKTIVSSWPTGSKNWSGIGVSCTYAPPAENIETSCRPNMTYQYEVDGAGSVSRIIITYWQVIDKPIIYDLKRETKKGIQL